MTSSPSCGVPPFDTADMQALDKVARTVTIEFFGQDAAILNGNATEDAYVIRTGQVELLDDNGIVDVLGPGELVGLPSLLTDMPAGLSNPRAAEDVLAYRIPADVRSPAGRSFGPALRRPACGSNAPPRPLLVSRLRM